MDDKCISCGKTVTHRQEAVQRDVCDRWCHRKCGTEIPSGGGPIHARVPIQAHPQFS